MKKYLLYVSQLYSFSIARPLQDAIIRKSGRVAWFLAKPEYNSLLKENEKALKTVSDVINYDPCAIFVASNSVPDFFPGVKVQLFHGFNAQKRNSSKGHFRLRGFFDLYCTQGPSTTLPFLELEKKYKYFKVVETGWPKMDPLFAGPSQSVIDVPFSASASASDAIQKDKPIVLFTSTFTPALSCAHKLYHTISELIDKNRWNWIITLHPKMDEKVVLQYKKLEKKNCRFIETDDIIPLLKQADVMLSDTSSVLSEFILQKKPVVTFRNRRPGNHLINVIDRDEIEPAIDKALKKPGELMDLIEDYIKLIHPYDDGKSSERVLKATDDFIDNDYYTKLAKKPLNITRRLKMRLKYHHYKW